MNSMIKTSLWVIMIGLMTVSYSCKCCHKKSTDTTKETVATKTDGEYVTGAVKKLPNLIGSCAWVIESTDGKRYETRGVPDEFFVDGLKIKFKFTVIEGLKSKCMTGTIIKVTDIQKL
jgi:hypothetical protein